MVKDEENDGQEEEEDQEVDGIEESERRRKRVRHVVSEHLTPGMSRSHTV